MKQENFILIISSPSGAGKTSLAKAILKSDSNFLPSISTTTRKKRELEIEGVDYFFVSKKEFLGMKKNNEFIETAKVYDNYYGSHQEYISNKLKSGFDILYDIDWQGARSLKKKLGKLAVSIFILPPSMQELEKRIKRRNQDHNDEIQKRLDMAHFEISKHVLYDYVLINNDFELTLSHLKSIINSERLKRTNYDNFINSLLH